MAAITLTKIDDEAYQDLKLRALQARMTVREYILETLKLLPEQKKRKRA